MTVEPAAHMTLRAVLRTDGEDPDEVRRRLDTIFGRPPFVRHKGVLQRLWEWITSAFDAPRVDAPNSSVSWLGAVANLVVWLALVALVIGLVVLAVHVVRRRVRSTRVAAAEPELVSSKSGRTRREWGSLAERYEAAGDWKEAIRCRHRELVADLVERHAVSSVPGRTTGELRSDVSGSSPSAAAEFDEATLLFELPWYADAPTGPDENRRFRELAGRVAGAARRGGFDEDELVLVVGAADDVAHEAVR